MSPTKKDIDPVTELVEEDEDQSLPEPDAAVENAAASLPAGRAVIERSAKLAPSSPGVYRMIDANGDVLYVGKAKNIRKRIIAYARPTGYDTRIERMIAATASLEFVSTATETDALLLEANLIQRLRPRLNLSLGAAHSQASRRATASRQLLRPVRFRLGGQPSHHRSATGLSCALVLGWIL